jgi:phage-related protein
MVEFYWNGIVALWRVGSQAVVDVSSDLYRALTEWGSSLYNALTTGAENLWIALDSIWKAVSQGILEIAVGLWNDLVAAFTNLWSTVSNIWGSLSYSVTNTAKTLWEGLVDGVNSFVRVWDAGLSSLQVKASEWWSKIQGGVLEIAGKLWSSVQSGLKGFSDFWGNTWSSIYSVTTGWANSIANAVNNMANSLWNTLQNLWRRVVGGSIWPEMWSEMQAITEDSSAKIQGRVEDLFSSFKSPSLGVGVPGLLAAGVGMAGGGGRSIVINVQGPLIGSINGIDRETAIRAGRDVVTEIRRHVS